MKTKKIETLLTVVVNEPCQASDQVMINGQCKVNGMINRYIRHAYRGIRLPLYNVKKEVSSCGWSDIMMRGEEHCREERHVGSLQHRLARARCHNQLTKQTINSFLVRHNLIMSWTIISPTQFLVRHKATSATRRYPTCSYHSLPQPTTPCTDNCRCLLPKRKQVLDRCKFPIHAHMQNDGGLQRMGATFSFYITFQMLQEGRNLKYIHGMVHA